MGGMLQYQTIIRNALTNNGRAKIEYHYDDGVLKINGEEYEVGNASFSEISDAVLGALRKLYGDYRTIPYGFNSEAYENDRFKAEVLALGSVGLLQLTVMRKTK